MGTPTKISKVEEENRGDFLYDLHLNGVELDGGRLNFLESSGYIKTKEIPRFASTYSKPRATKRDYTIKVEDEVNADQFVDVEVEDAFGSEKKYIGGKKIVKKDWIPHNGNVLQPEKAFVEFVDTINKGFSHKRENKKFNIYIQQAEEWLSDDNSMSTRRTFDEKLDFLRTEKNRCRENSLYFMNKYLQLKEGNALDGTRRYKAWHCQELICYLLDCGFSFMLGKLRQVGATSTIGGLAIKSIVFNRNYFCKFITENLIKGQEIFDDKIKYAFYHLPQWLRPSVYNDRDNLLRFLYKPQKGMTGGVDSKLSVEAPYATAINGGAPNLVLIDEAGNMPIITEMINEGRPALFWVNPETKTMEMKRQLVVWGTGGEMDKGGGRFEVEFRSAWEAWKERNFSYGIVPIFFDAYAKPGMTKELYEQEKKYYYSKSGVDSERYRVQFHQHYPLTIDDMFLRSSKTLIAIDKINMHLERIFQLKDKDKPQHGYFKPIYDYNYPEPEASDLPYKIIDTVWVPTGDNDEMATTVVFKHPERDWQNRYYQGTDPIFTDTGHSKMASVVWDNETQTVAACMNFRVREYKYCYLQTLLLGIYYHHQIKNLVESNVGSGFIDYIDGKGFWRTLVPNKAIHQHLQTPTGSKMGINNRANTHKFIVHKLTELIGAYGNNIYIEEFWIQCKTFVEKTTPSGKTTYAVEDLRHYFDDILYATVFAYICAQGFTHLVPLNIREGTKGKKVKYKYSYDNNFNLVLKKVLA